MDGTACIQNFVRIDEMVHKTSRIWGYIQARMTLQGIEILQTSFCLFKKRIRKEYVKIVLADN
jgi:hypothetical protein